MCMSFAPLTIRRSNIIPFPPVQTHLNKIFSGTIGWMIWSPHKPIDVGSIIALPDANISLVTDPNPFRTAMKIFTVPSILIDRSWYWKICSIVVTKRLRFLSFVDSTRDVSFTVALPKLTKLTTVNYFSTLSTR